MHKCQVTDNGRNIKTAQDPPKAFTHRYIYSQNCTCTDMYEHVHSLTHNLGVPD